MRVTLVDFTRRAGMILACAAFVFAAGFIFAGGAAAASVGTQRKATASALGETKAVAAKPADSASKGMNTGIKVHGHWAIVVKNPDGTVAQRRDFENNLITIAANVNTSIGIGTGSQALVALLSGAGSVGSWEVYLESLSTGDVSPCASSGLCAFNVSPPTVPLNSTSCPGGGRLCTLPSQLTLSGTVPSNSGLDSVQQSGTIDTVVTVVYISGNGLEFTGATLPQPGSGNCGGANQPGCAVHVSAGQSIAVSVTLSFD